MATIHHLMTPGRIEGEREELLHALILLLTSFGVDPDGPDDQAEAFENGIQTVEKSVGMSFGAYLKTHD